jgi:RNA polymerase sigma-70 factor (ECF subfamily)
VLREVFPSIVEAQHRRVLNFFARRGIFLPLAEDLLQDVFVEVYKSLLATGFPDELRALVRTIAKRRLWHHARDSGAEDGRMVPFPDSSERPKSSTPDLERILDLRELGRRVLPMLSPEHEEVIEARLLDHMTAVEIAAMLGLPLGTVKSRLAAAMRELYDLLVKYLPESQRRA